VGVAPDHVIESFRNRLWPGYKTGEGIERALAQFHPLQEGLAAMGVAVWPMIELEADDALATAARLAEEDSRVELVRIWTPIRTLLNAFAVTVCSRSTERPSRSVAPRTSGKRLA
jgi:hypothetical protein